MNTAIFGKYLYKNPIKNIQAFCLKELLEAFETIEQIRHTKEQQGYLVGYVSYEAGILLQAQNAPALQTLYPLSYVSHTPLLSFTLYQDRERHIPKTCPYFNPTITQDLNQRQYQRDFERIKEHIQNGESYQINYTQELLLQTHCSGYELFNALYPMQSTPYAAYFKDDFLEIVSFSPELFFKISKDKITVQPMKGTLKRGGEQKDSILKRFLKNDTKNRSENVMIVDLLRNDLSKISKNNSLYVKNLFKIVTLPTLFQMVSTIKARIKKRKNLGDIFTALFPCGSVTGAPKIETLKIIHQLEQRKRQVYCGAMGVISEKKATFSVPIRTLFRPIESPHYHYAVGSGVVWDSDMHDEFQELKLKTSFLFKSRSFCLFETLRIQGDKIFLLKEHLHRLLHSAQALGFGTQEIETLLNRSRFHSTHQPLLPLMSFNNATLSWGEIPQISHNGILKLHLSPNGDLKTSFHPLIAPLTQKIRLAQTPQNSHNDFLYHKTTQREHYAMSQNAIERNEIIDEIHYNERGEITEGSRSNVMIFTHHQYLTPPIQCGLLNGILRQTLLEQNLCTEAVIHQEDLKQAEAIYILNSVRGITAVTLE